MVVLYACGFCLCLWLAPPQQDKSTFLAWVGMLTVLLMVICWAKGEPPKWRWDRR